MGLGRELKEKLAAVKTASAALHQAEVQEQYQQTLLSLYESVKGTIIASEEMQLTVLKSYLERLSKEDKIQRLVKAELDKNPRYQGKDLEAPEQAALKAEYKDLETNLVSALKQGAIQLLKAYNTSRIREIEGDGDNNQEDEAKESVINAVLAQIDTVIGAMKQRSSPRAAKEQAWKTAKQAAEAIAVRDFQEAAKTIIQALDPAQLIKTHEVLLAEQEELKQQVLGLARTLAEIQGQDPAKLGEDSEALKTAQAKILEVIEHAKQVAESHEDLLKLRTQDRQSEQQQQSWQKAFMHTNAAWGAKAHVIEGSLHEYHLYLNTDPAIPKGYNQALLRNHALERTALKAKGLQGIPPIKLTGEGDQLSVDLSGMQEAAKTLTIAFMLETALAKSSERSLTLEQLPKQAADQKALAAALLQNTELKSWNLAGTLERETKIALFQAIIGTATNREALTQIAHKLNNAEDQKLFRALGRKTASQEETRKDPAPKAPVKPSGAPTSSKAKTKKSFWPFWKQKQSEAPAAGVTAEAPEIN